MKARCLLALAALTVNPAWAGEALDRRFATGPAPLVRVTNVKGEIQVTAWDRDEVKLTGELGEGSGELLVEEAPGRLRIEVDVPRNRRAVEDTVLHLMVPVGASIEAEAVSASIDIAGVAGSTVVAHAVSGDLDLEVEAATLDLKTVSGDIDLAGAARRTRLNSVSGDMDVEGLTGDLAVTTVSGEVLLRADLLSSARFETVSGDLELAVDLADGGELLIESLSGDIDLVLSERLSARGELESFSGSLRSDWGEVRSARYGPHQSLEFTAGDGSGRIRIETFSGDVRLRRR